MLYGQLFFWGSSVRIVPSARYLPEPPNLAWAHRYLGERDTEQTSASGSALGAALCLPPPPWALDHLLAGPWLHCPLWVSGLWPCERPGGPLGRLDLGVPNAKSPLSTFDQGTTDTRRASYSTLYSSLQRVTQSTSLLGGFWGCGPGNFPTNVHQRTDLGQRAVTINDKDTAMPIAAYRPVSRALYTAVLNNQGTSALAELIPEKEDSELTFVCPTSLNQAHPSIRGRR